MWYSNAFMLSLILAVFCAGYVKVILKDTIEQYIGKGMLATSLMFFPIRRHLAT